MESRANLCGGVASRSRRPMSLAHCRSSQKKAGGALPWVADLQGMLLEAETDVVLQEETECLPGQTRGLAHVGHDFGHKHEVMLV